jgi:hypothetical protein
MGVCVCVKKKTKIRMKYRREEKEGQKAYREGVTKEKQR